MNNFNERLSQAKKEDIREKLDIKTRYREYLWAEDEKVKFYNDGTAYRYKIETGSNIDFLIRFLDMNIYEAISFLLDETNIIKKYQKKDDIKKAEKRQDWNNYINMLRIDNKYGSYIFLTKYRKINKDIVNYLFKNDYIFRGYGDIYTMEYKPKMNMFNHEDKTYTYFIHKNPLNNEIDGLSCKINNNNQRIMKNLPNTNWCFNIVKGKTIENAVVFEAAVDLISFLELYGKEYKNTIFLSTGGFNINMLFNNIDALKDLKNIVVATDNDEFGNTMLDKIYEKYANTHTITRRIPHNKDWNDDLKENKNYEEIK